MSTKIRTTLTSLAVSAIAAILILLLQQIPLDGIEGEGAPPPGGAAQHEVDLAQAWADWEALPAAPRCDRYGRSDAPCNVPKYDREGQFGKPWMDVDGNGCNTRDDILGASLRDVELRHDNCTVQEGVLDDPYTGQTIDFTRGPKTSMAVQIDHVVPLSLAWDMGAHAWDQDTRIRFANDPLNLIAVDGPANSEKGDLPMHEWMPPNSGYHCAYAARFMAVSRAYNLPLTPGDKEMVPGILEACR